MFGANNYLPIFTRRLLGEGWAAPGGSRGRAGVRWAGWTAQKARGENDGKEKAKKGNGRRRWGYVLSLSLPRSPPLLPCPKISPCGMRTVPCLLGWTPPPPSEDTLEAPWLSEGAREGDIGLGRESRHG